jgi:FkbM family methyltransferase
MSIVKWIVARLPDTLQFELKRLRFARQIAGNTFFTDEPEYALLPSLIQPGSWVLDIGANVGHYTKRFSELVGPAGRVIAFEPVPTTFALLAENVRLFRTANTTLINAAVSDGMRIVGMSMPDFSSGLANFYRAHIQPGGSGELSILTLSIDGLGLDGRVALVKIDAEGHEASVLAGMREFLQSHRPVLIVETDSAELVAGLETLGYVSERLPDSPNILLRPNI